MKVQIARPCIEIHFFLVYLKPFLFFFKAPEGRSTDDEFITSVLVKFRFVVFRPFIDEVLTGRIRSCNHEGVQGNVAIMKFIFPKAIY